MYGIVGTGKGEKWKWERVFEWDGMGRVVTVVIR